MYATGEEPPWQQARERKHKEIDNAIPAAWKVPAELLQQQQHSVTRVPHTSGIMTQRELAITEMRAVDLLSLMKSRTYTAVQVTTAFCKRAAIAHQAVSHLSMSRGAREGRTDPSNHRQTASHTFSSPRPSLAPKNSTRISPAPANPLGLSTVSQ